MGKGGGGGCFIAFLANLNVQVFVTGSATVAASELAQCYIEKGARAAGEGINALRSRTAKFGEVPVGETPSGDIIYGAFGARERRTKGDYPALNQQRSEIKQDSNFRIRTLRENLQGRTGQGRENFLDQAWQETDQKLLDLRSQYELYGQNSKQGRLIDQQIRSEVRYLAEIEYLSGVRETRLGRAYQNRFDRGTRYDYGVTPQGGEFGRLQPRGEMSVAEKGQMQRYRDTWKINRNDAYDSLEMMRRGSWGSGQEVELQRMHDLYTRKIIHNDQQRLIYQGSDWKRTLDYEVLRDMKILKKIEETGGPKAFDDDDMNPTYLLPPHLLKDLNG